MKINLKATHNNNNNNNKKNTEKAVKTAEWLLLEAVGSLNFKVVQSLKKQPRSGE